MQEPFNYNFGDLVQAQIADVYDGVVETEKSELGGTAVIPTIEEILATNA